MFEVGIVYFPDFLQGNQKLPAIGDFVLQVVRDDAVIQGLEYSHVPGGHLVPYDPE